MLTVGLTILQKSGNTRRKKKCRIALVLAGGAISGGAFKLGGLMALNTYLENRKVIDLDIYVGVSAGAFLAAPLSAGIPPEELIRSIHGRSSIISQFKPLHFYYPNFGEFISKPLALARDAITFVPELTRAFSIWLRQREGRQRLVHFMSEPSYVNLEQLLTHPIREVMGQSKVRAGAISYLPSGLFDNKLIERFIRQNLRRNRLPNNFRLLHLLRGNSLYISATNLNTAKAVLFGHDEDNTVTISEAVQASSAIPGFYRPAKVGGVEYVDGGVRRTANLSRAADKGADLIIAYNPFRPFVNVLDERPGSGYRSLGEMGPGMVLDQVFRTLLASRLKLGVEKLALDPKFTGDLMLIEPTETDARMFNISPIAFWKRAEAAEAGYLSCKATLEQNHHRLTKLFAKYGVKTNLQRLLDDESALQTARKHDDGVFDVLTHDDASPSNRRLYVVK
jgi:NTE family protein